MIYSRLLRFALLILAAMTVAGCNAQNDSQLTKNILSYEGWNNISLPGVCHFKAPPTLEIKGDAYKEITESIGRIMELPPNSSDIVLQQRGLNAFESDALEKYCRVMVETFQGQKGEYPLLEDKLYLSKEEMKIIEESYQEEFSQQDIIKVIEFYPIKITTINGMDALRASYKRESKTPNKSPVIVMAHTFFNNDKMHVVTMSYREIEEELWKDDLEQMIHTFTFE